MYLATILDFVKEQIVNSALSNQLIESRNVEITPDEKPWPSGGQRWISIHPLQQFNPVADKQYIQDRVSFAVTIAFKTRYVPTDRLGNKVYLEEVESMETLKHCLMGLISGFGSKYNNILYTNYNLRKSKLQEAVQSILPDLSFTETFRYIDSDSVPVERYPDFFSTKDGQESLSERPAGHSLSLRFLAPAITFAFPC